MKNIVAFVSALSHHHDPYANAHAKNTAVLCLDLAKKAKYPEKRMEGLELAASLHDVGKLMIDEKVLNKVSKLTSDDMAYIKRHTTVGYEAMKALGVDRYIAEAVLYHHENWDGTGYPSGLKDETIPVEARIIRICDTFDSLTSKHAYRSSLTVEDSVRILESDRRVFDPILLDIFVRQVIKA